MPETRIGLFPDVGAGYFPRPMPGHIGEWLALTGTSIACDDAIEWGLGDVYVQSQHMPGLVEALCHGDQPSAEHVVATVMERADLAPPSKPDTALESASIAISASPAWAAIWPRCRATPMSGPRPASATPGPVPHAAGRQPGASAPCPQPHAGLGRCAPSATPCTTASTPARPALRRHRGHPRLAIDKDHQPVAGSPPVADVEAAELSLSQQPWAPCKHPLRDLPVKPGFFQASRACVGSPSLVGLNHAGTPRLRRRLCRC